MRKLVLTLLLIAIISLGIASTQSMASAANDGKPVIAVDLAHGENPKGLLDVTYKNETLTRGILTILNDFTWYYFGNSSLKEQLGIKSIGNRVTYDALKSNNVAILILGQPTSPLLPDEIKAIRQWLEEGGHVLWIAGDSDYGNGAKTQQFVDSLLDQLNITNLRVDLCSVEDAVSNAGGKSYRVIAYDDPWKDTPKRDILVQNLKYGGKVLAHGPGVVAWVDGKDGSGNWHPLTPNNKPDEAYVIVHSNSSSDITENNAPAANAYQAGQTGEFPIVAAQIVKVGDNKKPDVIIVSGETPIGGYEPMWASKYYDVQLDGPTVITNILEWSVEMTKMKENMTPGLTTTTPPTLNLETSSAQKSSSSNSNLLYIGGALIGLVLIGGVAAKAKGGKSKPSPPTEAVSTSAPTRKHETKHYAPPKNIPGFPPELLDKYEPLEFLGEGGFAKVFKVRRKSDGKIMALKVSRLDEKGKRFFLKEVKAWRLLDHPNIVKLYNAYAEPLPHLEIEFVDGIKLNGEVIRDLGKYPKPTDEEKALHFIKGIAEGLKHAHSKQVYHRDLKPQNVLITSDLTPKITDWGLAKVGAVSTTATTTKGLTLLYAAPEQLDDETYGHTDNRTDIYQLGLIFYELLTGRLPYQGTSPAVVMAKVINPAVKPKPPSHYNKALAKYDGIFEKLLAKEKEERYQSVKEFLRDLELMKKLDEERRALEKEIKKTKTTMSLTTDSKELKKLMRQLVEQLSRNALLHAQLNDKAGLINALEDLKAFSKEHRVELENAIAQLEVMMRESVPISKSTLNELKVLLHKVQREVD